MRFAVWPLLLVIMAGFVIAACGDDDDDVTPTPSPTPAEDTPTPTLEPTPEPGTPTPAPTPPGLPGASCLPQSGGDRGVRMFLNDVRIAPHEGFDRIVFEFEPAEGTDPGVPYYEVELTKPPLIEDPTGFELEVEGNAFMLIVYWASGVDLVGPEPDIIYEGPDQFLPGNTAMLHELLQAGDFEHTSRWFAGLEEEACFLVTELEDPFRLVVDIEAAS
jgi:hypothetical protein